MKITVNVTIEILKGSRNKYERPSFENDSPRKKIFTGKSGLSHLNYVCVRDLLRGINDERTDYHEQKIDTGPT